MPINGRANSSALRAVDLNSDNLQSEDSRSDDSQSAALSAENSPHKLPHSIEPPAPPVAVRPPSRGDLIALREFPTVIHGGDIRSLRMDDETEALRVARHDFASGYLGHDDRARHALESLLTALARHESGGAFFVNGVFGAGKSHLLGLMALLSDGIGHEDFQQTHPEFAPLLQAFFPRFVLHIALDEYDAARFSLEEIFWREVRAEWRRCGFNADDLALPENASRAESLLALQSVLAERELNGLLVCFDELSLFLAAREHRALQGDAAFLQFLGQHARRHALVVIGALQKTVEDVGELETYSLSQIRDRYTLLPLALAHLPSLIERRLIIRRDAETLRHLNHQSLEKLSHGLPRLDFGRAEWESLYPFHPPAIGLLEGAVSRFFSRTRSAVLFCAGSVDLDADATARVGTEDLFAYLAPELENHPDLRPLAAVWHEWQAPARDIAADPRESEHLARLMRALLLFKIAGQAPTVVQLANAAALDAGLPDEGNYEYARALLERLRTRAGFLAVERAENIGDALSDRYTIDMGLRVGEMARRHVRGVLDTLEEDDTRIAQYALACSRSGGLPLGALESNPCVTVLWRNTPRPFAVSLLTSGVNAANLVNRVMALGQPGQEGDALLLIVPPFSEGRHRSMALFEETLRVLGEAKASEAKDRSDRSGSDRTGSNRNNSSDARWRSALILWSPRRPTRDESEFAREAAAYHFLESDPQLLDNKRGRAILSHLKNGTPQREAALAQIAGRLLREGHIVTGGGLSAEAGEILSGDNWAAILESIAEFALPPVFPRFNEIAPRLRVLTPSNVEALCLDVLRRPANAPYFAPALERAARAIAEPLGIARADSGRWRITEGRADLVKEVLALCNGGVPLAHLEAVLAKSEWGLANEQTHLIICALLRSGQLVAADSRGQMLTPAQIGVPLSRSVRTLRPGQLLSLTDWPHITHLVTLLTGEPLGTLSFAEQEKACTLLTTWREMAQGETELAQARLHQLRRVCNHTQSQWSQTRAAWEEMETLLATLNAPGTSSLLDHAAGLEMDILEPALAMWRHTLTRLDERHAVLLEAYTTLTHPALCVPPRLQSRRAELLTRFASGEGMLDDDELIADVSAWRTAYAADYREWHDTQHAPARFTPYKTLLSGDDLRVLDKLATLIERPFTQGRTVREAAQTEWVKACAHSAPLPAGEAVCPHCRLRWGERLSLRDPREIASLGDAGLASFRLALREGTTRAFLERSVTGQSLIDWNEHGDGESESLLYLLNQETLKLLEEALRPRRRVTRSRDALMEEFKTCRTRREFHETFLAWLDNGEALSDTDEIELT